MIPQQSNIPTSLESTKNTNVNEAKYIGYQPIVRIDNSTINETITTLQD